MDDSDIRKRDNSFPSSTVSNNPPPDLQYTDDSGSNNQKTYQIPHNLGKKRSYLLPAIIFAILVAAMGGVMIYFQGSDTSDIRSRADNSGPVLSMNPTATQMQVGNTTSIGILLNTGTATVTATELHLTYDPAIIQVISFTPGSMLPVILTPASLADGSVIVTLGASPATPYKGSDILGTLSIKMLKNQPSAINFTSNTVVTAVGQSTNALAASSGITISGPTTPTSTLTPTSTPGPTTTPTPTSTPGPTSTPTPTPIPTFTCSAGIADTFGGSTLDATKWSTWKASTASTVTQEGGALTITTTKQDSASSPTNTAVGSILHVTGDFTAEVTVSNFSSSPTANGSAELGIGGDQTWLELAWRKNGEGFYVDMNSTATKGGQNIVNGHQDISSATIVKLKLIRIGSTAYGYVDAGSGYQLVATIPNAYSGDGYIQIPVFDFTNTSGNTTKASFTNLTISCPPVATSTPTPTPVIQATNKPVVTTYCSGTTPMATISWTGGIPDPSYGFTVNVFTSPFSGNYYNKTVGNVQSTNTSGFVGTQNSPLVKGQTLVLQPNQAYAANIWNGVYSPDSDAFAAGSCASNSTPTPTSYIIPSTNPIAITYSNSFINTSPSPSYEVPVETYPTVSEQPTITPTVTPAPTKSGFFDFFVTVFQAIGKFFGFGLH